MQRITEWETDYRNTLHRVAAIQDEDKRLKAAEDEEKRLRASLPPGSVMHFRPFAIIRRDIRRTKAKTELS